MSNGYTKVVIAQKACRLAGLEPVSTLDTDPDGDLTQFVLQENFDLTVNAMLTREYWRFATNQVQLVMADETPVGRWSYAYELPNSASCLAVQTVTMGGQPIEYDTFGRFVYCQYNEDHTLICDYTYPAPPDEWSPLFADAVVHQLAGHLAIAVQERPQAMAAFEKAAEERLMRAAAVDAMSQTNRTMPRGALTRRRGAFTARLRR